jgi:hypothetical protein
MVPSTVLDVHVRPKTKAPPSTDYEGVAAHRRREHQAWWPAITAVIHAHFQWAGPVILEGWQFDPERVWAVSHPQLRTCWLLVDEAVLEARLRADPAFSQGCTAVERLMRHYRARSRWVNDRVRQAAGHEAGAVIQVGPDDSVDTVVTRTVQRLWPGEASSSWRVERVVPRGQARYLPLSPRLTMSQFPSLQCGMKSSWRAIAF